MTSDTALYWKLSGFYFFFFSVIGVFGPYWSLYLRSIGFDAAAIGELIAIYIGSSFFAPYLWAWIADHTGKSMLLIRLASVSSVCVFSGVLVSHTFWSLALLLTSFSFFLNGVLPQLEANTMSHTTSQGNHYGSVRLWGSVGFIISALVLGTALDRFSIDILPKIALLGLIFTALITFFIPERKASPHPHSDHGIVKLIVRPVVIAFMAAAFMMFIGYAPYTIFFSIYLEDHGYQRGIIGSLWALGMIGEIAVFCFMSRLLTYFNFKTLLLIAYVLTTLRWLLIGFYVDSLPTLVFAQLLQAASIGLYHTVSIDVIHRLFGGNYQYRGQAIYVCLAGTASVVGILGSGYLWDRFDASVSFSLAALATISAFIITWRYIDKV